MQSGVVRRNSSKQGLQNLLRLTAQRSIEDAEEIERERRRRARELCCHGDDTDSMEPLQDSQGSTSTEASLLEIGLKASCQSTHEEDEGFGDWTQKMERHPQLRPEDSRREWCRANQVTEGRGHTGALPSTHEEEGGRRDDEQRRESKEGDKNRNEKKVSYISKVFLQQEAGRADGDKLKSHGVAAKGPPRGLRQAHDMDEEMEAFQAPECRLEQVRDSLGPEKGQQGVARAEQEENELEEKADPEYSCSISERTESLNRFVAQSNNITKVQNPVVVSKIDDRLEQYTHAIESSWREASSVKQIVMDIPSAPEPVASKKSFFEAVDACDQKLCKTAPSKDMEGLKVGVAELITQWVKGNPDDGTRSSAPKPADVRSGDVLYKKSLWETLGDSSCSGRPNPSGKACSSVKRYKFVVTGHGKYEKIPVNDDDDDYEYTNGQSSGTGHEDC